LGQVLALEIFTELLNTFQSVELPIVWGARSEPGPWQRYAGTASLSELATMNCLTQSRLRSAKCRLKCGFRLNAINEKGICIADPVGRKQMKEMLGEPSAPIPRERESIGDENFKFNHIIEAVSFVDSHKSIGVQLSDACIF